MDTKETKLIKASKKGDIEKVKTILEYGVDIHFKNNKALFSACANGSVKVIKELLKAGADIHAENGMALYWSAQYGQSFSAMRMS